MFQSDQSDGILCSVISDYDRYACGASLDNASFSCATFFAGGSGSGDWTDSGDDCGEIQGCSALVFGADGSADVSDTGYLSNVDSAGMVIPLVMINPLTSILIMFRNVVIYGRLPGLVMLLVTAAEAVLCLGVGCWFFYKHQDGFIFDL